ncbi:MAG: phosphotransferase, partial [Bacilli bacterium]
RVEYIGQYGSVFKVYTLYGTFALKTMQWTERGERQFVEHTLTLVRRGYNSVIPIFQTFDGRHYVIHDGHLFYLMPWLERNELAYEYEDTYTLMLRTLGELHAHTSEPFNVTVSMLEDYYANTMERWDRDKLTMERFLHQSEKAWYPSPFQMLFLSSYSRINQAHEYAEQMLDKWFLESESTGEGRTVLNHGNPRAAHFLMDGTGAPYWISFEHARRSTPVYDLVKFFRHSLYTYPVDATDRYDWLVAYEGKYPLLPAEQQLLMSQLAYPGPVYKLLDDYSFARRNFQEVNIVGQLQEAIWAAYNVEGLIRRMNEAEHERAMREFESRE